MTRRATLAGVLLLEGPSTTPDRTIESGRTMNNSWSCRLGMGNGILTISWGNTESSREYQYPTHKKTSNKNLDRLGKWVHRNNRRSELSCDIESRNKTARPIFQMPKVVTEIGAWNLQTIYKG